MGFHRPLPDTLEFLKTLAAQMENAEKVRREIDKHRHVHESTFQTLERLIRLAMKVTCDRCRGTGRDVIDNKCRNCTCGEVAYDPNLSRKVLDE